MYETCPACGQPVPDGGTQARMVTVLHDPPKCAWRKTSGHVWTCEHGIQSVGHPNGWCDQGCCR